MILCVTLNPCLDKTLTVPAWRPGDNVRGRAVREVVGGKGNNVARALTRLGRQARPATFLGGAVGLLCESLLRKDDGLDPLVVPTQAATRIILTVRTEESPDQSAFFDPDPAITAEESEALFARVEELMDGGDLELLTLSGSSPCAHTHGLYCDLTALARGRGVPVLLDTYGPALDTVWGFWPDVIQLNRREATAHLRVPVATDADLISLFSRWSRHGVRVMLVTDGPAAVLAQIDDVRFRLRPPKIQVVNPIGSGDCLLAGLADGLLSGLRDESLLRQGMACAVANALVWDAGAIEVDEVRKQEAEIAVERL